MAFQIAPGILTGVIELTMMPLITAISTPINIFLRVFIIYTILNKYFINQASTLLFLLKISLNTLLTTTNRIKGIFVTFLFIMSYCNASFLASCNNDSMSSPFIF